MADRRRQRDERRLNEGAEPQRTGTAERGGPPLPTGNDDRRPQGGGDDDASFSRATPPGSAGGAEATKKNPGPEDLERLLQVFLKSLQNSTHVGTSMAVQQHVNVSVENKIAANNVFFGHSTPGKEDFGIWQKEFDDRAERLG